MTAAGLPRSLHGDRAGALAYFTGAPTSDGCLPFQGSIMRQGYGRIGPVLAHRLAWEIANGLAVPSGLVVDHVCHNNDPSCSDGDDCMHRRCVNPDHLEAVTQRSNVERGRGLVAQNLAKTHCPVGHPFDAVNTYIRPDRGTRECRACRVVARMAWGERDKAAS